MFLFRSGISGIGMIHSDKHWYHSHLNGILKWFKQISVDDPFAPKFFQYIIDHFLTKFFIFDLESFEITHGVTFLFSCWVLWTKVLYYFQVRKIWTSVFQFPTRIKQINNWKQSIVFYRSFHQKKFPNWLNSKRTPWKFWKKVLVYFWRPEG